VSKHAAPRRPPTRALAGAGEGLRALLATCALGAAAAVALGWFAWGAPSPDTSSPTRSSTRLTMSYSATVPRSPVYEGTKVAGPDPIFRALADKVDLDVSYDAQHTQAPGSYAVDAILSAANGWHTTIPLVKETPFEHGHFAASAKLRLDELEARAHAAAVVAKVAMDPLTVVVQPTVTVPGEPALAPQLRFSLTPDQFRLTDPASAMSVVRGPSGTGATTPTLRLGPVALDAAHARPLALLLGIASVIGACVAMLLARRRRPADESAAIRSRYAALLVRVHPMPLPSGRPVVDVTEFTTLAKLADRYGLLVLHWARSGVETFIIHDESATYRYRTSTSSRRDHGEASDAPQQVVSAAAANTG
jgi:hypothetical protein